jgi:hypothetical protein
VLVRGTRLAIAGGAAALIGAFLPLMSNTTNSDYLGLTENGGARQSSAFFGVLLVGLAVALQYWSVPGRFRRPAVRPLSIALVVLASLGLLGYGGFAVAGIVGIQQQTDLFGPVTVTYSPGTGLILLFLGCAAVLAGAVRSLTDAG